MRLVTTGAPAAQASRILMRVPEPTRSGIAVAKARSRYSLTEATSPSMATSFEASAREHTALLVLVSPGHDGESERLVERTQDAQSAESASFVVHKRHGLQQSENARLVGSNGQLASLEKRFYG